MSEIDSGLCDCSNATEKLGQPFLFSNEGSIHSGRAGTLEREAVTALAIIFLVTPAVSG